MVCEDLPCTMHLRYRYNIIFLSSPYLFAYILGIKSSVFRGLKIIVSPYKPTYRRPEVTVTVYTSSAYAERELHILYPPLAPCSKVLY
jgi:hypothetical protein